MKNIDKLNFIIRGIFILGVFLFIGVSIINSIILYTKLDIPQSNVILYTILALCNALAIGDYINSLFKLNH